MMSTTGVRFVVGALAAVAIVGSVVAGQGLPAPVKARVDAVIQAFSSGDPALFERMAQENYAPSYLTIRTPEQRRQVVERIKSDFGTMTVRGIQARLGEPVSVSVRGSTGLEGRFEITLEEAAPYRVTRVAVRAGGGEPGGEADAGPPPSVRATMAPADLAKAIDDYIAPRVAADSFAGVVLVAKDGKTLYEKPFGLSDRTRKTPVETRTRFNIGSINKIVTKTAIAQLLAQGKLALTDTIGKLLPDYPNADAKVATVEQLLEHKAGIVDFFGPEFAKTPKTRFRSNADYLAFVAPQPLLFPPGSRTQYCNGCYVVLGAIIERVSGLRYEDYIARHIFGPAGMKGAGFFQSDRFPEHVGIGYTRQAPDAQGTLRSNEQMHGVAGSAAGGSYATAADLLAFDNALREHRLTDAKMTAWVIGAGDQTVGSRAAGAVGWAGGAPGCNAILEGDGTWTVAVVGNLDPPAAMRVGTALAQALRR